VKRQSEVHGGYTGQRKRMAKDRLTPTPKGLTRRARDFTDSLQRDYAHQIAKDPRAFKRSVVRLIRLGLPPGRGRPASPRIETAIEMLQQGKTVREVLQEQIEGFEQVDAYGRYLMEKALRQAMARRLQRKPKHSSSAQSERKAK
jgi:hypothetical protein